MCEVGDRSSAAVNRWDNLTGLGTVSFSRNKALYRINEVINLVRHVASQPVSQPEL